jgi:hypothetical protein
MSLTAISPPKKGFFWLLFSLGWVAASFNMSVLQGKLMRFITPSLLIVLIVPPVALVQQAFAQQISPNPNPSGNEIWVETPHITNDTTFVNNGTIDITSGGTLTNNSTMRNSYQGYFMNQGHLNNKGTLENYEGATLFNMSTLENLAGGTLTNQGNFENPNYIVNLGTLNNTGVWVNGVLTGGEMDTYGRLINVGTLTNTGKLSITQQTSSSFSLSNNHGGTLTNKAILINNAGSTLLNSGTLNNAVGAKLTNNGTIATGHGTFTNHGTLNGSGHIKGSYTDHGHTKPGHSAGGMTIDGDYFKRGGSKEIELGGEFHGGGDRTLTEFDWLNVTGNVELAGALDVLLIDSFELAAGMSFEILKVGGTLTGQYDGLDEGRMVGSYSGTNLYITYAGGEGNSVTLFSRAVPEPATLLLALLALVAAPLRVRCG